MRNWLQRDLKHNWHPYTQMKECKTIPPILIKRARGLKLYDEKGNWYYDTIASWWCNVHGHNHPHIKRAINAQLKNLDHVLFAGFTHEPAIRLAEELVKLTPPNLTRVFYSDNGSTAVETALKMSFQYWHNIGKKKKTRFVSLDLAYHGDTIGTMNLSGVEMFHGLFAPLFADHYKVPSPYCYRCPLGLKRRGCGIACLEPLAKLLKKEHLKIAALVMEPLLLAAGGMVVYPKQYLAGAARLAKKYGVHLILDEVATGFGRTGKMFACQHTPLVRPDFIAISKGLTAGVLPLGATMTTEKVYRAFYADARKGKTLYHGHTFCANPIACAVALASLEIFKKEKTLARVETIVPILHQRLREFAAMPVVGDVRCLGMVGAIELKTCRADRRLGLEIYQRGLARHILLRPLGNIIYLYLPLCVKKRELDFIIRNTYEILAELRG